MSETHDPSKAQPSAARTVSATLRKRVRMRYVLSLAGMFIFYALGLYSHPLLFKTNTDAPTEANPVRTQAPRNDERANSLGLQDLSVAQAYQVLAQEVSSLGSDDYSTPELDAKLAVLEREVRELRVLNPYYLFKEIQAEVAPSGVSATYGARLDVSFDQVQPSIDVMKQLDPTYGKAGIVLAGANLDRYVQVGTATSCQYCCNATTLVKPDGTAACGCAHSQAMRGLAAYLIVNHPNEYTDDELVEELNQWRAVYFPKQTLTEALVARQEAGEPGIEDILTEFPEFMPQMVGGC
jgi:hypothetical protein